MALGSGFNDLATTDTFSDWLNKTNTMIGLFRGGTNVDNAVTANSTGANSYGNMNIIGQVLANNSVVVEELRGGDYDNFGDLLITSNVMVTDSNQVGPAWPALFTIDTTNGLYVTNNTVVGESLTVSQDHPTTGIATFYGNTVSYQSVNVSNADSTAIIFGANVNLNYTSSGTDATIKTNATGDILINADENNEAAASAIDLRVDNLLYQRIDAGGNTTFYDDLGTTGLMRWDAANERLGILELVPESALDVQGTTRTDELIVDGSVTSNSYLGNTNYTDSVVTHSHYFNIRKGDSASSGIVWRTTNASEEDHPDTRIDSDASENLIISVNDTARPITPNLQLQSNGDIRQIVHANGNISWYENTGTTEEVKWDATANNLQLIDDVAISFGAGNDLQIYHEGSNSYITETGAGDLNIQANNLILESTTGENYLTATANGSVILYHDDAAKLTTQSIGVDIEGEANTDTLRVQGDALFDGFGGALSVLQWDSSANTLSFDDTIYAKFGTGDDLKIWHNGTDSVISHETNVADSDLLIRSIQDVFIQSGDGATGYENAIRAINNDAVTLFHSGSSKLDTTSTGINVTGNTVADGLQIDGNAYVSTNTHLGGTADGTHKLQVTGDAYISTTLEVNGNITGNQNVLPGTEGNDLGSTTARWDGFFNNVEIGSTGSILPETDAAVTPVEIGSATLRFNTFSYNANVYNDLVVDNDATIQNNITVNGTLADFNCGIDVLDDSNFAANTIMLNVRVDNIANVNILEVKNFQSDGDVGVNTGAGIYSNTATITTTGATTIDEFNVRTDANLKPVGAIKYLIEARNTNDTASCYAIEILVTHTGQSGGNVYYTRYAEVSNNMSGVTIAPVATLTGTGSNFLRLQATCTAANVSNPHVFRVVRTFTRDTT